MAKWKFANNNGCCCNECLCSDGILANYSNDFSTSQNNPFGNWNNTDCVWEAISGRMALTQLIGFGEKRGTIRLHLCDKEWTSLAITADLRVTDAVDGVEQLGMFIRGDVLDDPPGTVSYDDLATATDGHAIWWDDNYSDFRVSKAGTASTTTTARIDDTIFEAKLDISLSGGTYTISYKIDGVEIDSYSTTNWFTDDCLHIGFVGVLNSFAGTQYVRVDNFDVTVS